MNYEDKYQHYINLLNMSYDEVIILLNKQLYRNYHYLDYLLNEKEIF